MSKGPPNKRLRANYNAILYSQTFNLDKGEAYASRPEKTLTRRRMMAGVLG